MGTGPSLQRDNAHGISAASLRCECRAYIIIRQSPDEFWNGADDSTQPDSHILPMRGDSHLIICWYGSRLGDSFHRLLSEGLGVLFGLSLVLRKRHPFADEFSPRLVFRLHAKDPLLFLHHSPFRASRRSALANEVVLVSAEILSSLTSYFERCSASASEPTLIAACGWRALISRMASPLSEIATSTDSCSGDAPPGLGIMVTIFRPFAMRLTSPSVLRLGAASSEW